VQVGTKTLNIKAIQPDGTLLDEITIQHYAAGDFNKNGIVDFMDLAMLTNNWLLTGIWP
jgi:hypothetical protein